MKKYRFDDGTQPQIKCNNEARYRTYGFHKYNFNLCEEHAELYAPYIRVI